MAHLNHIIWVLSPLGPNPIVLSLKHALNEIFPSVPSLIISHVLHMGQTLHPEGMYHAHGD